MDKGIFTQLPGKIVELDSRFKYVMALALNSRSNYMNGIIRCITKRDGDLQIKGYADRSVLYQVRGDSLKNFYIENKLNINGEEELINQFSGDDWDFMGFEDPDIWIDDMDDFTHVYFTISLWNKKQRHTFCHLGHAEGANLDSLEMTEPVLIVDEKIRRAKEPSIAPVNKGGFRYNLIESRSDKGQFSYSTVRVAITENMGEPWKFGETVLHPAENNIPWIGGHASPGPLLSQNFIDVGDGKCLGFLNGREVNQKIGENVRYGTFSIGLFIYDYENGKIDWVSSKPFIQDSEAKTITFASQFVQTGENDGILYAHVDDSFVRAYEIRANLIKPLLI